MIRKIEKMDRFYYKNNKEYKFQVCLVTTYYLFFIPIYSYRKFIKY